VRVKYLFFEMVTSQLKRRQRWRGQRRSFSFNVLVRWTKAAPGQQSEWDLAVSYSCNLSSRFGLPTKAKAVEGGKR